jgi:hypothetical protein
MLQSSAADCVTGRSSLGLCFGDFYSCISMVRSHLRAQVSALWIDILVSGNHQGRVPLVCLLFYREAGVFLSYRIKKLEVS